MPEADMHFRSSCVFNDRGHKVVGSSSPQQLLGGQARRAKRFAEHEFRGTRSYRTAARRARPCTSAGVKFQRKGRQGDVSCLTKHVRPRAPTLNGKQHFDSSEIMELDMR